MRRSLLFIHELEKSQSSQPGDGTEIWSENNTVVNVTKTRETDARDERFSITTQCT